MFTINELMYIRDCLIAVRDGVTLTYVTEDLSRVKDIISKANILIATEQGDSGQP